MTAIIRRSSLNTLTAWARLTALPRFGWSLMLALCALATVAYVEPSRSEAQVADAVCTGSIDLHFSPSLGLIAQSVSLSGGGSVSCLFGGVSTHSADVDVLGGGNLSCLINANAVGTVQFDWDDGATSEVNWHSVEAGSLGLPSVPRVFVLQGDVVSGRFEGDTLVITYNDLPQLTYLKCLYGTLDGVSGLPTATFVPPL